jgi:hypothetical protein
LKISSGLQRPIVAIILLYEKNNEFAAKVSGICDAKQYIDGKKNIRKSLLSLRYQ